MEKSKHQKLADQLQEMIIQINHHADRLRKKMEMVQLYFNEKILIVNRPLIKESAQRGMMYSHYFALQILSPSLETRQTCLNYPLYARIIPVQTIFPDQIKQSKTRRYVVPWNVQILWPKENLLRSEKYCKQALLYCPALKEISEHLDWFEAEAIADSLTHQFRTIIAFQQEGKMINMNAHALSKPIFSEALSKWKNCVEHADKTSSGASLWDLEFSPQANQTAWEAWQIVVKVIREKRCLHRRGLLSIYRNLLQEQFFKDLNLTEEIQKSYLNKFEAKVFNTSGVRKKNKPGRWNHCRAISIDDAALIIEHFIQLFLQNPKQKKFGEIVCVLWIMIWCAQEEPKLAHEKDIIALTIGAIDCVNKTINIRGTMVRVSSGLIELLHCLCGKGHDENVLFLNISLKMLERELAKASQKVLIDETPVMPSAFLVIPHPFPGIRIEQAQRHAMLNSREMVKPCWTRHQIHKDFKGMTSA